MDITREIGLIRNVREKGSNYLAQALTKVQSAVDGLSLVSSPATFSSISRTSSYVTTSVSAVATGDRVVGVVAPSTGRIKIDGLFVLEQNTANDASYICVYRAAGGVLPQAGAAPGTQDTLIAKLGGTIPAAFVGQSFSLAIWDAGVVPGKTYSYYLALLCSAGEAILQAALVQFSD